MKSGRHGKNISKVELSNVSAHGFWLLIGSREYFLSFKNFPWFADATIQALAKVELASSHHLRWPDLDIDIAVESIEHPERYPLLSRRRFAKAPRSMGRVGARRTLKIARSTRG